MYMFALSLYILFSRTTTIGRMMMMIVVLRVCVSHLKRKWQHSSTLSWRCCTMQKCLLQKSPPLSIYSSLFYPSFSVSILYVAISERLLLLLLLLMGDVNHRCANNTKKHVHSTTKKREDTQKKGWLLLLLFFSIYR
jgi:hypothetical protein